MSENVDTTNKTCQSFDSKKTALVGVSTFDVHK